MERRSLLKSALASAAISAPVLAGGLLSPAAAAVRKAAPYVPAPASDVDDADEHLIALGREHAAAVSAWINLRREVNRLGDLRRAIAEQRGFTPFHHAAYDEIGDEIGYSPVWQVWSDLSDKLEQIGKQIRANPPRSLAGLKAWASAARFAGLQEGMQSERPLDYSEQWLMDALDHVERVAEGAGT